VLPLYAFTGTVRTLTTNVKVRIAPAEKTSDNAPDYRVYAGNFELGAAWKKTSRAERPYLSVTLGDPSFPATLYARLVEGEDGTHNLIWRATRAPDRLRLGAPLRRGVFFTLRVAANDKADLRCRALPYWLSSPPHSAPKGEVL
jgi:uncharacterized protein (DUF736 family)